MASGPNSLPPWEPYTATSSQPSPPPHGVVPSALTLPSPAPIQDPAAAPSTSPPWERSSRRLPPLPPPDLLEGGIHRLAGWDRNVQPATASPRHLWLASLDSAATPPNPPERKAPSLTLYAPQPRVKRRRLDRGPGALITSAEPAAEPRRFLADQTSGESSATLDVTPGRGEINRDDPTTGLLSRFTQTSHHVPPRHEWEEEESSEPSRTTACCSVGCRGVTCARVRTLTRHIASALFGPELDALQPRGEKYHESFPDPAAVGTAETLEWVLRYLKWRNASLPHQYQHQPATQDPISSTGLSTSVSDEMKRQSEASDRDADFSPRRQLPPGQPQQQQQQQPMQQPQQHPHPAPAPSPSLNPTEEGWPSQSSTEFGPPSAPHHRSLSTSSTGFFGRHISPARTPQPSLLMPSPPSMNLPVLPNLSSMSSPSSLFHPSTHSHSSAPSSAHQSVLQDLQHQITVKTLAHQTLQLEHNSLMQTLERQKRKVEALERKFEVTDVEINSLTDEKEALQQQTAALQTQVREVEASRDEARRTNIETREQYMKILQMATQLEQKGVDKERAWESEQQGLMERVRALEERERALEVERCSDESARRQAEGAAEAMDEDLPASSLGDEVAALRLEVRRLQEQNALLEGVVRSVVQESRAMRDAALSIASANERLDEVVAKLGRGEPAK